MAMDGVWPKKAVRAAIEKICRKSSTSLAIGDLKLHVELSSSVCIACTS